MSTLYTLLYKISNFRTFLIFIYLIFLPYQKYLVLKFFILVMKHDNCDS